MQINDSLQKSSISQKEKNPHLKDYLNVILARKWILISTFFLFTVCTTVFVYIQTPIFRATCRLEIQPASMDAKDLKAVYDPTLTNIGGEFIRQTFLETQYELILSNSVVRKTFNHFNLRELPQFRESPDPESIFRTTFAVKPFPDTWLADVTFEWPDPIQAAAILGYLVETYLEEYRLRSQGIDQDTLSARIKKVKELEPQVTVKFNDLRNFIAESGLVSLEDAPKIVRQHYDNLIESLKDAVLKRNEFKSRYEDIHTALNEGRLEEMPELFNNQTIHDLKLELINAQLHLTELDERFGYLHPEVKSASKKLRFIEEKIDFEKQCLLTAMKSEYDRAENTVRELRSDLAKEEAKVSKLNEKLLEYRKLKKNYEDIQNQISELKGDIASLEIVGGDKERNIQIIDLPKVPVGPVRPKKSRSIALAAFLGVLAGMGLCFFVEYLDTTIKTKSDIERILDSPVLGYVPPASVATSSGNGQHPPDLVALDKPHSLMAEAFRSIRTALMFSEVGQKLKSIIISSPTPSEGKTLVSLNVAVALAQSGKKVLLIDADLRKPRLYKVFSLPLEPGLSNILAAKGDFSLTDAIADIGVENMSFLRSGPHPPNPAELLGSEVMKDLLDRLTDMFDYVIIDTPPLVNATDAVTLAQYTSGVVLVVRSFKTERDVTQRAQDILVGAQVNLLGTILNNADVPRTGYYGYGSNYYYYYYHPYYSYYNDDKTKTVRKRRRRKSKRPADPEIHRESTSLAGTDSQADSDRQADADAQAEADTQAGAGKI